jgi:hypothetical protein
MTRLRAPKKLIQSTAAPLRLHPGLQVLERVLDAVDHGHDLGQQRLVARAVAIVGADGADQRLLVLAHEALQRAQVGLALVEGGHRMREIGLALQGQRIGQALHGGLVGQVERHVVHGGVGLGRTRQGTDSGHPALGAVTAAADP